MPSDPLAAIGGALALAVLAGGLAGLYSALRATRQPPTDALRGG